MALLDRILDGPRRRLRAVYDWTVQWSDTPHSLVALGLIALAEASFFPVPPDVLLIAIVAVQPHRWFSAAATCSLGSVVGAAMGYAIGAELMNSVGRPIIDLYGAEQHWNRFLAHVDIWGAWFLAAGAFTPIPFKVVTIASGATGMSFGPFLAISLVGRAMRFFLVAVLLRLCGTRLRHLLETHFDQAALLFFALLLGGFLFLRCL